MQTLQSLLAVLLITGATYADQPSDSFPLSSTSTSITSTVAAGVPVTMRSSRSWSRDVVLVGGISAVVATFIFALASRKNSA